MLIMMIKIGVIIMIQLKIIVIIRIMTISNDLKVNSNYIINESDESLQNKKINESNNSNIIQSNDITQS